MIRCNTRFSPTQPKRVRLDTCMINIILVDEQHHMLFAEHMTAI